MSIFKKANARKNKVIYKEMITELDKVMNDTLKSSGLDLTDLDEEGGQMLGRMMESYKRVCDLAIEQSEIIDRLEEKLDCLAEMNESILKKIDLIKV
jgi:hypothetical protein